MLKFLFTKIFIYGFLLLYTNEFKIWEFGKAGAPDLKQWNGDEAAQPQ